MPARARTPMVYIVASQRNGTLYTGVTSNILQRVWQHKHETHGSFTSQHVVKLLVYYEEHATMHDAITREKQIKRWNRDWKLRLIEKENPQWDDLAADWYDEQRQLDVNQDQPGFPPSRE